MAQHHGPLRIGERGRLTAMGVSQLGGLLNVLDQIGPRRGEAFIGLGASPTFHQGFHHTSSRHFLTAPVEDLLLKLSDQGIGLIGQLDRQLRHQKSNIYLICST